MGTDISTLAAPAKQTVCRAAGAWGGIMHYHLHAVAFVPVCRLQKGE